MPKTLKERQCPKCGRTYRHGTSRLCRGCEVREKKVEAVNLLGGKCSQCGYSKSYAALSFHHIDPSEKEFTVSDMFKRTSLVTVLREISKCVLLCANCHMEKHADEVY